MLLSAAAVQRCMPLLLMHAFAFVLFAERSLNGHHKRINYFPAVLLMPIMCSSQRGADTKDLPCSSSTKRNKSAAGGQWLVPFATIYRGIAVLGVSGTSGLPDHCLVLSAAAFCCAILLNALRDWGPTRLRSFLPIPTALAIPFYGEPQIYSLLYA